MKNVSLGYAERAVYELLERGPMTATQAGLYRRPLASLVAVGLVKRRPDLGFERIDQGISSSPANPKPEPLPQPSEPPAMATLTARVPAEYIDMLDAIGPTRSDALRAILKRASGSGLRKRAV